MTQTVNGRGLRSRVRVWAAAMVAMAGIAASVGWQVVFWHAYQASVVPAGQAYEVDRRWPVHLAGAVSPGDDATRLATCTFVSPGGGRAQLRVGMRTSRWDSIPAGTRVMFAGPPGRPLPPAALVCDRTVAVASGPVVHAYLLADHRWQPELYLGVGLAGAALAVRARKRCQRSGIGTGRPSRTTST